MKEPANQFQSEVGGRPWVKFHWVYATTVETQRVKASKGRLDGRIQDGGAYSNPELKDVQPAPLSFWVSECFSAKMWI